MSRGVEKSTFVPGNFPPIPLCYFLPSWVLQWVALCPELHKPVRGRRNSSGCENNENREGSVQAQYLVHWPSWVLTLSQTGKADTPWLFSVGVPQATAMVVSIPGGLLHGSVL